MPLPEFSHGQYGALKHYHLNEAFRRIKSLEDEIHRLQGAMKRLKQLQPPDGLRLGPYEGYITARSGATNATYDVETRWYPHFTGSSLTPVNRDFDTADVTFNAANVNAPCLILLDEDRVVSCVVWETITPTECA